MEWSIHTSFCSLRMNLGLLLVVHLIHIYPSLSSSEKFNIVHEVVGAYFEFVLSSRMITDNNNGDTVCMCTCVCICGVCEHVLVDVCIYEYVCPCVCICGVCEHVLVDVCIYEYVCPYVCPYVCICGVCEHVLTDGAYTSMYVHVFVFVVYVSMFWWM